MFKREIHRTLYLCCLMTLAISIPLSVYAMSVGSIFLVVNAFIEWNWKEKWQLLKKNRLALILAGFFFVYLIGLIHAEFRTLTIDAILMKIPLLGAPLVLASTAPLTKKEMNVILHAFLGSILFTTLYSFIYFSTHQIIDIREISVFISHIRFSLNIVLAIVFSLFYAFNIPPLKPKIRLPYAILTIWLLFYLFIAQTLTGIVILVLLTIFTIIYTLIKCRKEKSFPRLITIFLLFIFAFSSYFTYITVDYFLDKKKDITLPAYTERGNPYYHDSQSIIENGYRIESFICKEELEEAWSLVGNRNYHEVEATLIRYLNSKGLKKDYLGVLSLSNQDITNIEQGIANINYLSHFGLKRSLYPVFFSISTYLKYETISHSSLLQRCELWSASWGVIKENWLFGTGIGNHKTALDKQLEYQQSELTYKKKMGCHNQFITLWLSAGIIVLLYFIFTLIAPFIFRKKLPFIYIFFFIIVFVSMLTEDTIDTHAGVTFFAFFNAVILFGIKEKN